MANTPPDESEPKNGAPGPASAAHGGAAPGEAGQAQAGPAQSEPPKHHDDIIAGLRAEVADLKDRLLRAHAEVENIRKRSEREKEETAKYAVTRLARDIVNVGDNFQRAIDAVPPDAVERDAALKSFLEGVTLTERELLNVLERYGIRRIDPKNEPFNPHMHQAVMEMQRTDVPAGTVVQVFQAGFVIEDRVLRPAMVGVAKGGPKPTPGGETPAGEGQAGQTSQQNSNGGGPQSSGTS
jgi:molecular chaperone GrpE